MAATGFSRLNSSLVTSPADSDLPVGITFGSISVSSRVDQPPTGTVIYKALTQSRLREILDAWDISRSGTNLLVDPNTPSVVTLHGTTLALESASYQRERYNVGGVYTELYTLTLQLGDASYILQAKNPSLLDDAADEALRTGYIIYDSGTPTVLAIGKGKKWSFPTLNVDSATKSRDLISHEKTEIQLTRRPVGENYYLIEPKIFIFWEGDAYPDRPPEQSLWIADLANLFDQGGPRKESKKTEKIDGVTVRETVESWGFLYYTADSPFSIGIYDFEVNGNPMQDSLNLDPWVGIPPLPTGEEQDSLDPYAVSKYKSGGIVERTTPPYKWSDLDVSNGGAGFQGQPRIWVTVGYRETNYIYEELENVVVEVEIIIPNIERRGAFIIDPKYRRFVEEYTPGINRIVLKTRAKYLTEVRETGWEYMRVVNEEMGNEDRMVVYPNDFSNTAYYSENPMVYKKIPITRVTKYELASTRYHYDSAENLERDKVPPPFSISFVAYTELDVEQKAEFQRIVGENEPFSTVKEYLTPDYKVAVVTPDPNYVEPLFPIREATHEQSGYRVLDTATKQRLDGMYIKYHATGTESIVNVVRTPIVAGAQKIINGYRYYLDDGTPSVWYGYSEYTSENNAQGEDFLDIRNTRVTVRDVDGLPPEAQVQIQAFVTSAEDPNGFQYEQDRLRYYLTTTDNTSTAQAGQTLPIDASTIEEATPIIELLLKKDMAEKIQAQINLRWYYPTIAPGDTIRIESEFGDEWIVYGRSWEEDYKGINNPIGKLVTTSGTNLTLGLLGQRRYNIESTRNGYTNEVDPLIKVKLVGTLNTIERVLPTNLTGRRVPSPDWNGR